MSSSNVKVFILAGQSNMEGHGQVQSLENLGTHLQYGHLLKNLKSDSGSWAIHQEVTVSWQSPQRTQQVGPLTIGWGVDSNNSIGPELMFGAVMKEKYQNPILLIKTAWGGKDVWCDFRSPSAGEMTSDEALIFQREGNDRVIGAYYRKMVDEIRNCLSDLGKITPDYHHRDYEICGLAWFQGWNDFCQWHLNLDGRWAGIGLIDRYAHNLATLFSDLRHDLGEPELPIAIGELGIGGYEMVERAKHKNDREAQAMMALRKAQRKVGADLDLNPIVFVPTADFWDQRLDELRQIQEKHCQEKQRLGIANDETNTFPTQDLQDEYHRLGGHWYCHYNGSATTYSLIGYALAQSFIN